ncbi:MAG: hypothetical protein ACR5LF_02525 [Symbiopectobacterium sp.]
MNKASFFGDLVSDLTALITGERRFIIILANSSALLFERLEGVKLGVFLSSG